MTTTPPRGRLTLNWSNKHLRLLAHDDGSYEWVEPTDFRVSEVRLLHNVATVGGTHSDRQRAKDNLVIRGDALHALTSLLRIPEFAAEYEGKVRLVYIDPPFNTGQVFAQYDDGLEHSVWLSMLRDRLQQIKKLLAPNGSVWVHLDDVEAHRARVVLDEVFGADNFVATVVWQKAYSPRNDASGFSSDQDYVLVYGKQPGWQSNRLPRAAERDQLYRSPDGDPAPWVSGDPAAPGGNTHQGMVYAIQSPFTGDLVYPAIGRHWSFKQEAMKDLVEEWGSEYELVDIEDGERRAVICGVGTHEVRGGVCALMVKGDLEEAAEKAQARFDAGCWPRLYFTRGGRGGLKLKRYLGEISQSTAPRTLWMHSEVGHNRSAKSELNALFPGQNVFATPKPERLMERVLTIATDPGDIVLDCFGGSGTTAAVAHKMGRRWVTVEWEASTVADFLVPRLTKVVNGEDPGGITAVESEVPARDDLPEGLETDDAKAGARALKALVDAGHELVEGVDPAAMQAAMKVLRAAGKTTKTTETRWEGGGGFRVLEVAPSVYEIDEGTVLLADALSAGELAESVAAQLGFTYEPNGVFVGHKGRMRLAVIDGLVGEDVVRFVVDKLAEGERVTVVATAAEPGAEDVLRKLRPGSRLRKVPRDLARLSSKRSEVVQLVLDGVGET